MRLQKVLTHTNNSKEHGGSNEAPLAKAEEFLFLVKWRDYFPLKSGALFSTKAAIPSFWSAEAKVR